MPSQVHPGHWSQRITIKPGLQGFNRVIPPPCTPYSPKQPFAGEPGLVLHPRPALACTPHSCDPGCWGLAAHQRPALPLRGPPANPEGPNLRTPERPPQALPALRTGGQQARHPLLLLPPLLLQPIWAARGPVPAHLQASAHCPATGAALSGGSS